MGRKKKKKKRKAKKKRKRKWKWKRKTEDGCLSVKGHSMERSKGTHLKGKGWRL